MDAVLLAGGRGTRLAPLTLTDLGFQTIAERPRARNAWATLDDRI